MKVTHILLDGTVRDSMKGYVIPFQESTRSYYEFVTQKMNEQQKGDTEDDSQLSRTTVKSN